MRRTEGASRELSRILTSHVLASLPPLSPGRKEKMKDADITFSNL